MQMFNVGSMEAGSFVPLRDGAGNPFTFTAGAEAARFAAEHTAKLGKKFFPRPVISDDWKKREQARFDSGEYKRLPWIGFAWFDMNYCADHFAHVSVSKSSMVAFTESPEKGAADRQTRLAPGTYLKRFFGNVLTERQIQTYAERYAAEFDLVEVRFARTADEIERVYRDGPDSCMSNEEYRAESGWGCDEDEDGNPDGSFQYCHPVRVYAAGDLSVAYLENRNGISARALVWESRKTFGRFYGDEVRLKSALRRLGFTEGEPIGARIVKDIRNAGPVCPYIDAGFGSGGGSLYLRDAGEFLKITDNPERGQWATDCLKGHAYSNPRFRELEPCQCCGAEPESLTWVRLSPSESAMWCDECLSDCDTYYYFGEYYSAETRIQVYTGAVENTSIPEWFLLDHYSNGGIVSSLVTRRVYATDGHRVEAECQPEL